MSQDIIRTIDQSHIQDSKSDFKVICSRQFFCIHSQNDIYLHFLFNSYHSIPSRSQITKICLLSNTLLILWSHILHHDFVWWYRVVVVQYWWLKSLITLCFWIIQKFFTRVYEISDQRKRIRSFMFLFKISEQVLLT